jgi:NDP-sugar pyrophosphorylase family protein
VHEKNPLGTAGGLGLLPDTLPDLPIIMINGDVLTKIDFIQLLKYHEDNQPVCTMCVRQEQYKIPYGVVESVDKKIVSLVEKPTYKYFINAGVYVISREMLSSIKKNVRVDMTDLIEKRLNNNEFVAMFPVHEYWLDIGQKVDFYQAQKDMMGGSYFEL